MEQLFEKASRLKMRFSTARGVLSIEDLWDLPLTSLNTLAKLLNKQIKEEGEEDFIATRTKKSVELNIAFELVKYVIKVKLEEAEAVKARKEKKERKQTIMRLISEKKDEALGAKSVEELEKELEGL